VLHLWHAEADRALLAQNDDQLDGLLGSGRVRARRGLSWLEESVQRAAAAEIAGGRS
jgi:hypothetical protein